ncbi:MAG TPA: response regulator transcription factor [Pseudobdellovibrionaceae bacterium]|nr:response regulator transcription factor [Pseudobdellovibrionaceae bacterium]
MKIVIVEDEVQLAKTLHSFFLEHGYEVTTLSNYEDLKQSLNQKNLITDIVILDRMLGLEDGASLIPKIKTEIPQCRVLVLSAINTAIERANVLDLGADDYMGKPYLNVELLSRVRNLARRSNAENKITKKIFGNTRIDLLDRRIFVENKILDFTNKEYQVLYILLLTPQKIFSKLELLERVWDMNSQVESNVVEVTIKNIRKKLEEASSNLKIQSKRHMGYWIET